MPTVSLSPPPAKRHKVDTKQNDGFERIQRLENLLTDAVSEGTSLNPLVDLLDVAKNAEDPYLLFKCIYTLYRVFASILDAGMLVPTSDADAKVVRTWISEKLNVFTDMLVGLMSDEEKSLRVSPLRSVRVTSRQNSPVLCNKNPLLPPQTLVIFLVLWSGCPRSFYFVKPSFPRPSLR